MVDSTLLKNLQIILIFRKKSYSIIYYRIQTEMLNQSPFRWAIFVILKRLLAGIETHTSTVRYHSLVINFSASYREKKESRHNNNK